MRITFVRYALAIVMTCLTAVSWGQNAPSSAPGLNPELPTLWIIGDSTVRNGTKGQMGWGDPIKAMFDTSRINVVNRAMGGRSSRTFRTEGRWEQVLKEAKAGDFVLMQFGHNDASALAGDNRERGTIRGSGEETEEVTLTLGDKKGQKETVHTFGWYMRSYITEAKAKGMTPIVCSYVPRVPKPTADAAALAPRPNAELTSYQLWAKQSADAAGAMFIDLNTLVLEQYTKYTPLELKQKFFTEADGTHTNADGAALNATCVVNALRASESPLKAYLKPE